mmetsp:Transcript_27175/g.67990  ORF Transcript_27175/g.67990 Transcript_27175/m.67990 type:complete len:88 (+) Transcript_27175:1034-1297(+)
MAAALAAGLSGGDTTSVFQGAVETAGVAAVVSNEGEATVGATASEVTSGNSSFWGDGSAANGGDWVGSVAAWMRCVGDGSRNREDDS